MPRHPRFALILATLILATCVRSSIAEKPRYVIAVHGGAGGWTGVDDQYRSEIDRGIRAALTAGRDVLDKGGASLDAVEAAVRVLENDPSFNAGRGAIFNINEGHMLDASIMDGRNRDTGGVTNVSTVKNPISLARLVMDKTRHALLGGDGAEQFARKCGVEIVSPEYFSTERRLQSLRKWKKTNTNDTTEKAKFGTVGCVALDQHGNLAAATSTGGRTGKMYGRIGDSPVAGAGNYADNNTCAVGGTGVGELFLRHLVTYDVAARMKYKGQTLQQAVTANLTERLPKGTAGIIAIDSNGGAVLDFNTRAMPRGVADSTGRFEVGFER